MLGKLYIVPTPIGNLKDITFRAVEIFQNVSLIAAEDTRTSSVLLKHYNIQKPTISYHKFNEQSRVNQLIEFLRSGKDIALISDAGTPGISDPATILIRACLKHDICVETLPGATAFVPALVSSGFDTENFYFIGFLPKQKQKQFNLVESVKKLQATLVFYESPNRVLMTLQLLREVLGNRDIVVAREISKMYETYYRFNLLDEKFPEITYKGEFVLVVQGYTKIEISDEDIMNEIAILKKTGVGNKTILKELKTRLKVPKNRLYDLILNCEK